MPLQANKSDHSSINGQQEPAAAKEAAPTAATAAEVAAPDTAAASTAAAAVTVNTSPLQGFLQLLVSQSSLSGAAVPGAVAQVAPGSPIISKPAAVHAPNSQTAAHAELLQTAEAVRESGGTSQGAAGAVAPTPSERPAGKAAGSLPYDAAAADDAAGASQEPPGGFWGHSTTFHVMGVHGTL